MDNQPNTPSPFHQGEQDIQTKMGVRDKMEKFGRKVIRDHMPEQHRAFYQQLPFVFVAHADQQGWPWASILYNPPGFIQSPDNQHLTFDTQIAQGDPLANSIQKGTPLGMLGIELPTRRRNRLSGKISEVAGQRFSLKVDQTFGNCPQYIQSRALQWLDKSELAPAQTQTISELSADSKTLVENADTFFVASYMKDDSGHASEGADVSHRGGMPGFIRVDNNRTLTIPDYLGNNHYNTFGNLVTNNKAGLLFIDFEQGHLLTLTGTTEILWQSDEISHFAGAQRLWRFHIDHGHYLKNVLPVRWAFDGYSPNSQLTGTWQQAQALAQAEQVKNRWQDYSVADKVVESESITSFYLIPKSGIKLPFLPGQFLTIRANIAGQNLTRTYSLSNAPADDAYRISVKHEAGENGHPEGVFSSYLHQHVAVGDTVQIKAPTGGFTFDASSKKPAVLLAAGVGITPMVAMAKHALIEGFRTRSMRPVTIFAAAKNHKQRAFFSELTQLAEQSGGEIKPYWTLSNPEPNLKPGTDYHHSGRINKALLQAVLPLDDYEFYLCGPAAFMQHCYDMLLSLGVNDNSIMAEAFGPASLTRQTSQAPSTPAKLPVAQSAIVQFADSQVEQAWDAESGNLLEFAEAHGIQPEFSCRSGQCGACKTKLVSGAVSYDTQPSLALAEDEVLICCAKPAATEENVVTIKLEL